MTRKFNSSNCNMSFVELQRTQSLTRPTTHAAISNFSTSHNSISCQYSQSYSPRVLQHQKQTQYSMLQNKTYLKKYKKKKKKKGVESTNRSGGEANATTNNVGFFSSYELRKERARYLPMPPNRHGLTQGQKPEGRLKWR